MNTTTNIDDEAVEVVSSSALAILAKAEIDSAVATAHAFPRDMRAFLSEAKAMVTFDENMAQACIYALPRKDENGKKINITGPSARFAEVIQSCYGNSIGGGRVIGVEGGFVIAQGVFHDTQKNVKITMEVRRRVTGRNGKLYSADMIGVTGNAAASIAHRNSGLKGVPKALWLPLYEAAVAVAIGEGKPMSERRARAFEVYGKIGVDKAQILAALGLTSEAEITEEHIETLVGWRTAIKEGTATIEEIFGDDEPETTAPGATGGAAGMGDVAAKLAKKRTGAPAPAEPKAQASTTGASDDLPATNELIQWIGAADSVAKLNELWDTFGGDALADYLPDDAKRIVDAYETRRGELPA